jgi:putative ABC transport system substrate-binding protein
MRRREFIGLLGGVAGALTCADVFAAQKSPMARIGYLDAGPIPPIECCADPECKSPRRDWYENPKCPKGGPGLTLVDLHERGWREGENVHIEGRFANGDLASLTRLAAELVALRLDVLIAPGSTEAKALQAATSEIPIVFLSSSDPVGYGLVESIARPGRNITGLAIAPQMLWGKRLDLVVALLGHRPSKVASLSNPEEVAAKLTEAAVEQSAEKLGIEVERWQVRKPEDLERVFASPSGSEAVLVQSGPLTNNHSKQIADLAVRHRLPTLCEAKDLIVAGGVMSYGWDYQEIWSYGARYVDRILRGARPKDLPVEQLSKFQLVLNLKTATALGLAIPPSLLALADEVIE